MRIKKGIIIQKMGKSFIVYDNETSTLHELNETAYFILENLKKKKSKAVIIENLTKTYAVSKKKAKKDYEEFLEEFKKAGLIKR